MCSIISVNDLTEGMILAEPVVNNFGQILLNSGVILTAQHKRILKTWNIHSISILNDDEPNSTEISDKILALAEESLKKRFDWTPVLDIEKDLFETAIRIIASDYKESV